MGNLTDDMTRLRGEIDALRNARGALIHDLAQGAKNLAGEVFAMRAGFAGAHAARAKMAKEERRDFVSGMFSTVSSLLADFSCSRADMARSDQAVRGVFVSDVKKTVASLLKNTAEDLEEARRVWRGPTVAEKSAAKEVQAEQREHQRREAEVRRQKAEQKRQEADALRLKEEQLRGETEAKRQEEERRLAAATTKKGTERRKMEVSPKAPEDIKKAKLNPTNRRRKEISRE